MAVLSKVGICNLALGWLGANLITSIDDDSTEAQLCKTNFDSLRRLELSLHEWLFAQQRAILAALITPPVWGYAAAFQVPGDSLKINFAGYGPAIDESEAFTGWSLEGTKLMTDQASGQAYIRYTMDLEDLTGLSEPFVHALAGRIAMELAMPLTHSANLLGSMTKLYAAKIGQALPVDQMQARTRVLRANGMLQARRSGTSQIGPFV